MYDYEYDTDVLLFLRLAKYLHSQNPAALEPILKTYGKFDLMALFGGLHMNFYNSIRKFSRDF